MRETSVAVANPKQTALIFARWDSSQVAHLERVPEDVARDADCLLVCGRN